MIQDGADMIDLGCTPGRVWQVALAVEELTSAESSLHRQLPT